MYLLDLVYRTACIKVLNLQESSQYPTESMIWHGRSENTGMPSTFRVSEASCRVCHQTHATYLHLHQGRWCLVQLGYESRSGGQP